jgi:hypothetical protein
MLIDKLPPWALATLVLFFGSLMIARWLDSISNKRRKRES